jgi:alpha-mannosidase
MFATIYLVGAQAAGETLWSIGKADQTGKEFAIFGKSKDFLSSYPQGLTFTVGKSPDSAWPFVHPGPLDKWAGSKSHDLKIRFALDSAPAGICALVVNAVSAHPRTPFMRVRVNGHEGGFRCSGGGDQGVVWDESKKSPKTFRFEFLPKLLRTGQNEIELAITSGCWVLYDELHLEVGKTPPDSGLDFARVEPSPCYVRCGEADCPAVRVTAINRDRERACEAIARCGGDSRSSRVRLTFGENVLYLPVPPASKDTPMELTLSAGTDIQTTGIVAKPGRKWTLYVVPSIHTDIGYTDRQVDVFKRHNDNLDKVLAMCRKNPSLKWNIEVAWEVENYLAGRPQREHEGLLRAMRSGRIGLQAGYLNFLTALMSDEAMNRYAAYAKELSDLYGVPFESALMTDIPSAGWGLCGAMAGSGIRWFAEGCNADRGPMLPNSGIRTPFYWEAPDGRRVLTWLTNSYAQSRGLAEPHDLVGMQEYVSDCVRPYDCADYPYDAIYVYGAFFDNAEVDRNYASLVGEWNRKIAWPKIVLGDGTGFFRAIEKDHGTSLTVRRGDFGAYWEDGAGSTAFETILHMGSQRRASAAETLWALAKLADPSVRHPAEQFRQAWKDILFYAEHTWGAAGSVHAPDDAMTRDQWEFKGRYAHDADRETRELEIGGMSAYLRTVSAGAGDVVVVNTMSWPRSGLVQMPSGVPRDAGIVDEQDVSVPTQVTDGSLLAYVTNVPAFGHRVLKLHKGTAVPAQTSNTLENSFYSVRLDPQRGVTSIIDRQTGRELVDQASPYTLGQVVYAAGGEHTRIMQHSETTPTQVAMNGDGADGLKPPDGVLLLTRAQVASASVVEGGPLFSEARIASAAPSMPQIETIVRLYHHEKRLSFDVQITSKTEIRRKEAVYVAFPLAATQPKFRLGMTNAVADPKKDFIHGACHEWYCVQDFVSCKDGGSGHEVVWCSPDAPLITLSDVNRGRWLADADISTPTLFSYVMNNYWHTNYKAGQGGDFRFRYELTSCNSEMSDSDALRFARHVATPLAAGAATGSGSFSPQPPRRLTVEGAIASLGCSDNGDTILRLRNADERADEARITLWGDAVRRFRVEQTDLVGANPRKLPELEHAQRLALKPGEIATVRIRNGAQTTADRTSADKSPQ